MLTRSIRRLCKPQVYQVMRSVRGENCLKDSLGGKGGRAAISNGKEV
jgi:hypothetical protein